VGGDRFNGPAIGSIAVGGLLAYAGIKGYSIPATIRKLISGQSPAGQAQATPVNTAAAAAAAGAGTAAAVSAPAGNAAYDSSSALQALWTSNGGDEDTAAIAAAIAQDESGGDAGVTSPNPGGAGCLNVGIWQLATPCGVGAGYTVAELQDANTNARITVMATRNGTDWSSWDDPVANALPGRHYTPGSAIP
jgi:lysozyme-like protein